MFTERAECHLWLPRDSEFAYEQQVHVKVKRTGDFHSHWYAAAGKRKQCGVRSGESSQVGGQPASGIGTVAVLQL